MLLWKPISAQKQNVVSGAFLFLDTMLRFQKLYGHLCTCVLCSFCCRLSPTVGGNSSFDAPIAVWTGFCDEFAKSRLRVGATRRGIEICEDCFGFSQRYKNLSRSSDSIVETWLINVLPDSSLYRSTLEQQEFSYQSMSR